MEPFLQESWDRQAERETGDVEVETLAGETSTVDSDIERYEHTRQVRLYKQIKSQSEADDITRDLLAQLEKSILLYYNAILFLDRTNKAEEVDLTAIESAEDSRTRTHNVVIDNLNALSRVVGSRGLDNEWRRVIGLDQKQVTEWVKKVAPYILLLSER